MTRTKVVFSFALFRPVVVTVGVVIGAIIRTMLPGDIALIKGGQMHSLINVLDENALLFMFGGYD